MKRLITILLLLIGSLNCSAQQTNTTQLPTGTLTSPNLLYPGNLTGTTNITAAGGTSGGSTPGFISTENIIAFGYTQRTAAYNYALSTALQGSGMTWLGYNYSWDYLNQDYSRGTLSAKVNFAGIDGTSLHSKSWNLGPTTSWTTVSGTETFVNPLAVGSISSFSLSFTGKDDRFWAGYYGPQVRNANMSILYTFDSCSTNPLSSPNCPGYAEAYKTQQCNANPLYDPSCPGYASAMLTQQCSVNPLYSTQCPGYAQAYFNDQCIKDSLYDKNCEGYATAYAIKYLVNLDPSVTNAVNQQLTTNVEIAKNDPAKVTVVNSTVDSVLATPSTTSVTSITSVNSVIAPPPPPPGASPVANAAAGAAAPPPPPPPAKQEERAQDQKRADGEVAKVERGAKGDAQGARKEVGARAAEIAKNAGKAATMEAQVASQGLLVGLMGYVPGFNSYQTAIIQDTNALEMARRYSKPVVDNARAQRRLSGANELKWREMVDSQYKDLQ